ncbi:MAG: hypothetical protein KAH14_04200 [Clostridiales bacterium]|nr:hypothetical protein [Clostridiales bacterium]
MTAYFYIDKNDAEEVKECGLKLSIYGDEVLAEREHPIRAIRALLSPKDDILKYGDSSLACLKLDIPNGKLLVAEEIYLDTGNRKWFNESVVHAENYIFGTYRKPCYLITFTVNDEYIGILDKSRDVTVLYDDSEKLYILKMKAEFEDRDENFYDKAIYGYLDVLQRNWKASIEWQSDEFTIFGNDGKKHIIRNPENEK